MPHVKLDCAMVHSTVYIDRDVRDVFITALLMAKPFELVKPTPTIRPDSLEDGDYELPPGWYGMVEASGPGIVSLAQVPQAEGMKALATLCSPESASRSKAWEGRRMARVDGGYVVLNYIAYRDRDYGSAERMRRFRARNKSHRNSDDCDADDVTEPRNETHSREQIADSRRAKQEKRGAVAPRARAREVGFDPSSVTGLDPIEWQRWITYRKGIGKPIKAPSLEAAAKKLAAFAHEQTAVVDQSIAQGWTGLFELKRSGPVGVKQRPMTVAEAEDLEIGRGLAAGKDEASIAREVSVPIERVREVRRAHG